MPKLFPTTLVGSYPQPDWLIDREKLAGRFPPRVRAKELWRVAPEWLEQAQDDATLLAIRDQERAGLDIITDGEMRRESYSNRFATALEGVDIDNPGTALDRSGHPNPVPRVVGKIRRKHAVEVRDLEFLQAPTPTGTVKITVPGPFTMSQQAQNDFYKRRGELALDYAAAVNEEIKDLFAAGADIVQIDEPYMQARPEKARAVRRRRRSTARSTASPAPPRCTSASATPRSSTTGRRAIRSCPSSPTRALKQISIETAQSNLDCVGARQAAGQDDHPRRARPQRHERRDAGDGRRAHPPRAALRAGREDRRRARLRHEVPAARRRLRQDEGDGRRRGDRQRKEVGAGKAADQFGFETGVQRRRRRGALPRRGACRRRRRRPAAPRLCARRPGEIVGAAGDARQRVALDDQHRSAARPRPVLGGARRSPPASTSLAPGSGSDSEMTGPTSRFLPSGPISIWLCLAGRGEEVDRAGADAGLSGGSRARRRRRASAARRW